MSYSLVHLSDQTLLRDLAAVVAQDRITTAAMLAHLAEVDARRLYLPAAYPSMYAWCVGELRMSEDVAFKRIRVARAARRFPAILPMVADGRLHLSGLVLLAPCLTQDNAEELLAAAVHKSKAEVERLIAERFPQPDLATLVQGLAPTSVSHACGTCTEGALALAPAEVCAGTPEAVSVYDSSTKLAPGPVSCSAAELATPTVIAPQTRVAPLSPGRFALQLTVAQETHDKLRYAQALLGHAVPSGDLAQVLDRALDVLIQKLEQQRFAAGVRTRPGHRLPHAKDTRYVPAAVRRQVWQRDQGRCTFVSETGQRCPARTRLEFDHIEPFARGGEATPSRLRLRCRAHNQYQAERVYGAEFMRHKREQARRRAAEARAARACERAAAQARAQERADAEVLERERAAARKARAEEVIPWLRSLGFSAEQARRGATRCADMVDAPLEERVRAALSSLAPSARKVMPMMSGPA